MDQFAVPGADRFQPMTDSGAQRVREAVLRKLGDDPVHYLSLYSSQFGNVLNADDAATLFEEYNQDRARYRVAVHPAAAWIRDELFRRSLADAGASGKGHVVFAAGANAAGKSTAIQWARAGEGADVVFDSTFSNPDHARRLVAQALESGRHITLLYIDRPLDDSLLSMLERATHEGRVVGINQLIYSHQGAAQTVRRLWNEFRNDPRLAFRYLANSSAGALEGSIALTQPQDYTEIR